MPTKPIDGSALVLAAVVSDVDSRATNHRSSTATSTERSGAGSPRTTGQCQTWGVPGGWLVTTVALVASIPSAAPGTWWTGRHGLIGAWQPPPTELCLPTGPGHPDERQRRHVGTGNRRAQAHPHRRRCRRGGPQARSAHDDMRRRRSITSISSVGRTSSDRIVAGRWRTAGTCHAGWSVIC